MGEENFLYESFLGISLVKNPDLWQYFVFLPMSGTFETVDMDIMLGQSEEFVNKI